VGHTGLIRESGEFRVGATTAGQLGSEPAQPVVASGANSPELPESPFRLVKSTHGEGAAGESRSEPAERHHGQGRCLGNPTEKVREMRQAESVLGLIREERNEALESWVRSKDACPVREGAEGKGPGVAPRRRPTSLHVRFRESRGLKCPRLLGKLRRRQQLVRNAVARAHRQSIPCCSVGGSPSSVGHGASSLGDRAGVGSGASRSERR